ncbi:hypothetical protein IGS75_02985 [Gluconobacter sphaericus]|uniref:hypothetical protein n=1 Tax=Gluconobacter sphaericus TaxID=574987 RepID=UPI001922F84F|nr:hypothetical protein [Gluconobacter sphaericus]QQX91602.1 hypothetical protein IGS75_02985 [Gluconobacter sphaericus]
MTTPDLNLLTVYSRRFFERHHAHRAAVSISFFWLFLKTRIGAAVGYLTGKESQYILQDRFTVGSTIF